MTSGLRSPLERLDRFLARAVDLMRASHPEKADRDPFRGLYITGADASRSAAGPRVSPFLGVAEQEPPLRELLDPDSVLGVIVRELRLSSFDADVLLIALAPEVDLQYERLYAFLQDDVALRRPTVDLVLTLLCATAEAKVVRREHFASDAPLLRDDVLTLDGAPSLLGRQLRVDDAIARRILGVGGIDHRLRACCTLVAPHAAEAVAPADAALAELVAEAYSRGEPLGLYLSGPPTIAKRECADALACSAVAPLLVCDPRDAADDGTRIDELLDLVVREAALQRAILYLEPIDRLREPDGDAAPLRRLGRALARHAGIALLAGVRPDAPRCEGLAGLLDVRFAIPDHDERGRRWAAALAAAGVSPDPEVVERLADRFRLSFDQIADAVAVARRRAQLAGGQPTEADLFAAARSRSDTPPSALVQKIEPIHEWGDLVLPEDTVAQLQEMVGQIVARRRVLHDWGFGRRHRRGNGVSALFAGPSGTGKTTAAEILGGDLGLDLFKIDLSGVVSKYIGETEKNLERVFGMAENANAIIFFDEADALFGKRSEVRDSHDRYANIEIAYLLERMERYDGLAILATNLRENMDDAFIRRLQFVVEFPFPSEDERALIWRLQFPPEAERAADIDFAGLARQFRIPGGSIRNIVLGAAFLAACDGRAIDMPAVLHATRREYEKTGRVLGPAQLGPYAELAA